MISCPTQSPGRARIRARSSLAVRRRERRRHERASRAGAAAPEDDHPIEVSQHMAEAAGPAAPPGLRAPEGEVLAEQRGASNSRRPVSAGSSRTPAPSGLTHRHPAPPDDFQQTGNPEERVGPELDRVAPLVVDPSDDHVDRVEARSAIVARPGCC